MDRSTLDAQTFHDLSTLDALVANGRGSAVTIHTSTGDTMARTKNVIFLLGNVGRDPDVQTNQQGVKIAHLSLATDRAGSTTLPNTNVRDMTNRIDWHRLTLYGRLAQFVEDHVGAGDRIYVEGTLQYDSYERDGITIPTAEVIVRDITMLTPKSVGAATGASED